MFEAELSSVDLATDLLQSDVQDVKRYEMTKTSKVKKSGQSTVSGNGSVQAIESDAAPQGISGSDAYEGDFDFAPVGPKDFDPEKLLSVYRTMLLSRRLDGKMLNLIKQGKGYFHIGCAGHEAVQAAVGLLSKPGHDWFSMYYRDLAMYLMLGGTTEEVLLLHLSKKDDPNSGGRQMGEHFSNRERNILPVSSSVGAQFMPAVGAGLALLRQDSDAYAYCSCGDGATSQGDFHEALNWAARSKAPVLFLVEDNKYAISVPVSEQTAGGTAYKLARGYEGLKRARLDGTDFFQSYAVAKAALEHIRSGLGPVCLVADVVRLLPHSSSDNHTKYRSEEELEEDRSGDPIHRLEEQLKTAGILSGERIAVIRDEVAAEVNAATAWAESQSDPGPEDALKHVVFQGNLDLEFDSSGPAGESIVMVDAINHALHEEMERDERVIVYGEDVAGGKGGVFTATRELTSRFGQDRCFNSPLAEASIIGTAVGLSAAGYKPVVEIQFGDYIWPAMQMLRNQVASFRYRSNGSWSCPMVIRVPIGGYIHGGPCHSQNIEACFAHMPGFLIAMPSSAADAKGLLKASIRMKDPILFLEHKALYRAASARSPEPDADHLTPFGKARIIRDGSDMTLITYGIVVHKAVNAAQQLEKEGISVEIIDLRTIIPLDSETIMASVAKTSRALVIHEDHEFAGFGAEISAQIADRAFDHLDAPVKRVAGKFAQIGFADPIEKYLLPTEDDIIEGARELASF